MTLPLLATQLVGSYTKPKWLYNGDKLLARELDKVFVPGPDVLAEAKDDAVLLAILEQERAGLDIITDGEQRRESFANYFYRFGGIEPGELSEKANREGMDLSFVTPNTSTVIGKPTQLLPKVSGPISWPGPMVLDDLRFLKAHANKATKMTVIGPITASFRLADHYYGNQKDFALALAAALNQELRALDAEGVDVLQLDEPDVHFRSSVTNAYVAEVLSRAIEGVKAKTVVHICYGYSIAMKNKHVDANFGAMMEAVAGSNIDAINIEAEEPGHNAEILKHAGNKQVVLGALNLGTEQVETPEHIAARIREALQYVSPEQLMLAPDCGMWFLPRRVAYGKIRAMALGAEIVRAELQPGRSLR